MGTRSTSPPQYSSFAIVYDISIVVVNDINFEAVWGKNLLHGSLGNKTNKPSIAI